MKTKEMARELAEHQYNTCAPVEFLKYASGSRDEQDSILRVLGKAEAGMAREWLQKSPEDIQKAYRSLVGDSDEV